MKIKKVLVATLAMALTVSPLNVNFEKEVKAESISDWLDFRWDFETETGLDNSAYIDCLRQYDKDESGYLDLAEQASVKEIRVVDETDGKGTITKEAGLVYELTHIEKFVNLEKLYISNCNVINMDLTKCSNLKEVYIQKYVGGFSIDASNMANLETFVLGDLMGREVTQITSIDFSNDKKLKSVMLINNPNLEKLSFSGCSALDAAYVMYDSKLTFIDVSDCVKLRYFDIRKNTSVKKIYVPSTFSEANLAHKWESNKAGNGTALVSGFYYDLPCTVIFGKPGTDAKAKKFVGDPAEIQLDKKGKITYVGKKFVYKSICFEVTKNTEVKVWSHNKKSKIKTLKIPDKVTYEGRVYKVTEIGDSAFAYCKKLKKVTFGKNIKKIGSQAFRNCDKLSKLIFKGKALKKVKRLAFTETAKKIKVTAPKKVKKKYKKLVKKAGAKKVK